MSRLRFPAVVLFLLGAPVSFPFPLRAAETDSSQAEPSHRVAGRNLPAADVGIVSHVKLLSGSGEDVSSPESWKQSHITSGMSDQEKLLAIWRTVVKYRHQIDPPDEFLQKRGKSTCGSAAANSTRPCSSDCASMRTTGSRPAASGLSKRPMSGRRAAGRRATSMWRGAPRRTM
jgi:hypothetical protein